MDYFWRRFQPHSLLLSLDMTFLASDSSRLARPIDYSYLSGQMQPTYYISNYIGTVVLDSYFVDLTRVLEHSVTSSVLLFIYIFYRKPLSDDTSTKEWLSVPHLYFQLCRASYLFISHQKGSSWKFGAQRQQKNTVFYRESDREELFYFRRDKVKAHRFLTGLNFTVLGSSKFWVASKNFR